VAKAVVRNDWRAKSNADSDAYSYAKRHTNSDTHPEYNPESYTNPDIYTYAYAYTVTNTHSHRHGNPHTKTYSDPETSARATPSTDTSALRRNRSLEISTNDEQSVMIAP
jgi:hypothetical protein